MPIHSYFVSRSPWMLKLFDIFYFVPSHFVPIYPVYIFYSIHNCNPLVYSIVCISFCSISCSVPWSSSCIHLRLSFVCLLSVVLFFLSLSLSPIHYPFCCLLSILFQSNSSPSYQSIYSNAFCFNYSCLLRPFLC